MEISALPKDKKIILFDGICNLCDSAVQIIIKHDKKDLFRFVPLQSELGQQIIKHIGISTSQIDSMILYEPGKAYYYKSDAAFRILKELSGVYKALGVFSILPKPVLNYLYDCIARNRYKWYGRQENCMVPTPELQSKFLA